MSCLKHNQVSSYLTGTALSLGGTDLADDTVGMVMGAHGVFLSDSAYWRTRYVPSPKRTRNPLKW